MILIKAKTIYVYNYLSTYHIPHYTIYKSINKF